MSRQKKEEKLSEAMNYIGDDLIRDASENIPVRLKPKNGWVKWVAIAAAVTLMLAAVPTALFLASGTRKNASPREEADVAPVEPAGRDDVGYAEMEGAPKGEASYSDHYGGEAMEAPLDDRKSASVKDRSDVVGPVEEGPEPGDDPEVSVPDIEGPTDETEPPMTPPETEPPVIAPGQLTAGAWNDNDHFALWSALFAGDGQGAAGGKFAAYVTNHWELPSRKRVAVKVTSGGSPVAGATVTAKSADGALLYQAKTDAAGNAYLFGVQEGAALTVASGSGSAEITVSGSEETVELPASAEKENTIELMFVLDVTGSMGDELSYIKREVDDVVDQVIAANPGTKIMIAFLTYRDEEDEDEFRFLHFVDASDKGAFLEQRQTLAAIDAMGGGDYPEAVDEALLMAVNADWSDNATTKLIFHVLDAPAHETEANKTRYSSAVRTAASKGIRICPILSSGADLDTEYLSRSEAVLTGGTFIFLTDDSGIGGGHLDPQLPDAVHEYLNLLLIRVINGYHTGTFAEPVPWYEVK